MIKFRFESDSLGEPVIYLRSILSQLEMTTPVAYSRARPRLRHRCDQTMRGNSYERPNVAQPSRSRGSWRDRYHDHTKKLKRLGAAHVTQRIQKVLKHPEFHPNVYFCLKLSSSAIKFKTLNVISAEQTMFLLTPFFFKEHLL